ncbi:hypothetical protein ACI3PL_30430, partial [Lacticaseibacillus paracasei]
PITLRSFLGKIQLLIPNKSREGKLAHDEAENAAQSLCEGFNELQTAYRYNPWQHKVSAVVGVLSNASALRWAIAQKERG